MARSPIVISDDSVDTQLLGKHLVYRKRTWLVLKISPSDWTLPWKVVAREAGPL